jgi:two-component system response regulator AtoC
MTELPSSGRKITLPETSDFSLADGGCDPAAARRFGLLIFCEGEAQLRLLADGTSLVIGRQAPSEIIVDDPSVSRQHARFTRHDGEVWVEDLDSRNGTFCQGQRIQRERLDPRGEIDVGKAHVVLASTCTPPVCQSGEAATDGEFIVLNARMKQVYQDVARAARGDLPVLVLGETGVGKENVARALHAESARHRSPFVVVNCAAIPAPLLESTLFGHERGSFTGAASRAIGVFERAHGGVLFLDEIGDLALGAQVALLRAIETKTIARVGSSVEIPIDVHVVAATHCDLEAMVEEGTFRKDLFYRLNGIALNVPPLRERRDEIEPLARLFLARAAREWGAGVREVTPEAMEVLRHANWPGNVRQLRHVVERAALLATGPRIGVTDWPESVAGQAHRTLPMSTTSGLPVAELALKQQLRIYERALIEESLRRTGGNRQLAAKLLRIPLRTLFRRIRTSGSVESDDRRADA